MSEVERQAKRKKNCNMPSSSEKNSSPTYSNEVIFYLFNNVQIEYEAKHLALCDVPHCDLYIQ